ncbi:hypothetical protein Y032_0150g2785 [Ancylostoma ceylanicum]|uniref:poly(ADP-ribose) glycohydrolase n=1 Tax=Ancylostoma ceylanicum TaxID=53326 RepID=A0A016T1M9_9BILA|nr:hypothetical protein Y032_0150g2785 [Ancylostoma ceylanicum]
MVRSDCKRLDQILNKASNNHETSLDLNELEGSDYCGFSLHSGNPFPKECTDIDLNYDVPGFVRLPWSTANITDGCYRYKEIAQELENIAGNGVNSIGDVIDAIKKCAPWIKSYKPYNGLQSFMDHRSNSEQREVLDTITGIARLALRAKTVFTKPLPLLVTDRPGSVTLSQEQCACLLANAFFCTFEKDRENYNKINFSSLFNGTNPLSHVKLQFILNYFSLVLKKMPDGCVSFRRTVLSEDEVPKWEEDEALMPLVAASSDGTIEDASGCLQVDFASKFIGGGAVRTGAVQEEIRFLICPEMIVSSLLCERMGPREAIHIIGAQRYSSYAGYGRTLACLPYDGYGSEPRDQFRRVISNVVAMDARNFRQAGTLAQYTPQNINRELNKAYAAFMTTSDDPRPVASGNWGCGVFGGDKELKSLIQMLAAAKARRSMIYYTFNDEKFEAAMNKHYGMLIQNNATIGIIYRALMSYGKECERNLQLTVFQHVEAVVGCTTGRCP